MIFSSFNTELVGYYDRVIKECIEKNDARIEVVGSVFDTSNIKSEGTITVRINWILKETGIPSFTEYSFAPNN